MFQVCPSLTPLLGQFEEMKKAFRDYQSKIPTYGGILISKDRKDVLLVTGYKSKGKCVCILNGVCIMESLYS